MTSSTNQTTISVKNSRPNTRRARKVWTEDDDQLLLERFQHSTAGELSSMIGCAESTVYSHARLLGLWKDNRYGRNHDARELIRMEYATLSNRELAKRTGLTPNGVWMITKELGLKRTPEQKSANLSKGLKETYRKERARVTFGLDPKTGLKVFANKKKQQMRGNLGRCGYIIVRGSNIIYYDNNLVRKPRRERNAMALGLTFQPLPAVSCAEETGELPASPAVLRQGNGTDNYQPLS